MLCGWSDGSRCGALSPVGTGSADKCPWGGGGTQGSRATSLQLWQPGGHPLVLPSREALFPACGHSFIPQVSTSTRGCGGTAASEAGRAGARGEPLGTRAATLPLARGPLTDSALQTLPQAPCVPGAYASAVPARQFSIGTTHHGSDPARGGRPQDVEKPHFQVCVLHMASGTAVGGCVQTRAVSPEGVGSSAPSPRLLV